jgi:hypothetical protein
MYQSINEYQFKDAFRAIRPDNFSYEGLTILFEGLEQYEVDNAEPFELDVIELCCDFSESSESQIKDYYSNLVSEDDTDIEGFLNDNTWVLGSHEVEGVKYFIYQQF